MWRGANFRQIIMAGPQRKLTVKESIPLSPNLVRVILSGDELEGFPSDYESGYVKLIFREDGREKPLMRSYTVRAFDSVDLTLTLDFVCHGDNGPASTWVNHTSVGDLVTISGPGPTKLADQLADWFFFAGDMSALPAIAVNLEKLPAHARGYAVIEIMSLDDRLDLKVPSNMELIWVLNPRPEIQNTFLAEKVCSLAWLTGEPYVWVASEFETMRKLRRYFKIEKKLAKQQVYASSYWKMGTSDEGNKLAKAQDSEADI